MKGKKKGEDGGFYGLRPISHNQWVIPFLITWKDGNDISQLLLGFSE